MESERNLIKHLNLIRDLSLTTTFQWLYGKQDDHHDDNCIIMQQDTVTQCIYHSCRDGRTILSPFHVLNRSTAMFKSYLIQNVTNGDGGTSLSHKNSTIGLQNAAMLLQITNTLHGAVHVCYTYVRILHMT